MGRSQRHMVVEQGAAVNGEAGAQGELAPTYVSQLLAEEEVILRDGELDLREGGTQLVVPIGPNYGPLAGSSMAGAIPDWYSGGTPPPEGLPVTITSLTPAEMAAGTATINVVAAGTGFQSGCAVMLSNAGPLYSTFVSDTQLDLRVEYPALIAGTHSVKVINPDLGQATFPFTVTAAAAGTAPTLTALTPETVYGGFPNPSVFVSGTGFSQDDTIVIDGVDHPTSLWLGKLSTYFDLMDYEVVADTPLPLVVRTAGGAVSNELSFTVKASPAPTITSVTPNFLPMGTASNRVAIVGTNFWAHGSNVPRIHCGLYSHIPTVIDSNNLSWDADTSTIALGEHALYVKNPDDELSNELPFTMLPGPVISLQTPAEAPALSPDVTVTVDGTGFIAETVIYWNNVAAPTTFLSATQLTFVAPTAAIPAEMWSSVQARNPDGGQSENMSFHVLPPAAVAAPVLTSLTPSSFADTTGPNDVTVVGTGFVNGCSVLVDGVATGITTVFVSETQLTARIEDGLTLGTHTLTVKLYNGPTSNGLALTVTAPPPAITSLTPVTAVEGAPDTTVTVAGTGFVSGATITWNSSEVLPATFVSATSLTFVAPTSTDIAGVYTVVVNNPDFLSSASTTFTITTAAVPAAPVLTTLVPNTAVAGGVGDVGTVVNGTGFTAANSVVYLNGSTVMPTTFFSATQLFFDITPAWQTGAQTIVVTVSNDVGLTFSNPLNFTIAPPAGDETRVAKSEPKPRSKKKK